MKNWKQRRQQTTIAGPAPIDILRLGNYGERDVHKQSGVVLVIMASGMCAGLILASQSLADFVHRPSGSRADVPTGVLSDARAGGRPSVARRPIFARRTSGPWANVPANQNDRTTAALSSMLPASLTQQAYSMSAPEFLSDPATTRARSIAVGDVSGDGRDDLIFLSLREAPNPINNRMEIYAVYQRSDGRLDAAVKIAESGNNLAYQLLISDLDRDGAGDIITATVNGVMVLRSNADGTFTSSTVVAGNPAEMVVTDVDRDGHLDVLVDSSNTSATVVHGDGRGGISRTSTLPLPSSAVRTTGDVTGDGLDDLILATIFNRPLQEFHIYRALASGGYATPVVLYRPLDANQTGSLAVGDFNADGRGDLALEEAKDSANLHLYFQDSQGNLVPSPDIARRRGSGALIATDLDRDGRTDLAIAHTGWSYIGYYLQTAAGFVPETVIDVYQFHGRLNYFATGDLNHDGCGDLAVARWSQSPVLLYGQGCVRPPVADCQLPPLWGAGPGLGATGMTSRLVRQNNGNMDVNNVREGLTRGTPARLERIEYR